ncbi:MAG: histidine kinase N-terminal 7TM domain-containing protein, partial [Patescibacteria group bacterium]|nr:histidine kinase N-terminal 7TM domain-containing protein [Patescibacteria group bacterium]
MNYILLFNLIFSLLTFIIGVFVYLKRRGLFSLIFFFLCLFASIWAAGIIGFISSLFFSGTIGLRIAFSGASFLLATLLYFVQIFPKEKYLHKVVNILLIGALILIGLISISSDLIVKNIKYADTTVIHKEYGPLYPIFGILFLLTLILCLVFSFLKYRTLKGIIKKQSAYFLTGLFISFILATITNLICPLFKIGPPNISQYGPLSLIFFIFFTTLAITRYHLFEIRVILTEILVGVMGIILLFLPFLMPTTNLKILTILTFILFCIFGYYLVKATHEESKRREEAERIAIQEKALRQKSEKLAREFERLNRAKTQFLLATQHHLRSP